MTIRAVLRRAHFRWVYLQLLRRVERKLTASEELQDVFRNDYDITVDHVHRVLTDMSKENKQNKTGKGFNSVD